MVQNTLLLPPEFKHLAGKILSSRVYPEFFSLAPTDDVLNVGCGEGPQVVVYAGSFKSMTCVDIVSERLDKLRRLSAALGLDNVTAITSNVEAVLLPNRSFDAALAIDIIEHVEHPELLLKEIFRLLKPGGRLLITFPVMHDKFVDALAKIKCLFTWHIKKWVTRRTPCRPDEMSGSKGASRGRTHFCPDEHRHQFTISQWRRMCEDAGFKFQASRATTMFPPLHLYGMPRFWFSSNFIHTLDSRLAKIPRLQNLGQTVMMAFVKHEKP